MIVLSVGNERVICNSATVKNVLDGVGDWAISLPATDERGEMLTSAQAVRVAIRHNGVLIAAGYINDVRLTVDASGQSLSVSGVDELHELQRYTTYRGRVFDVVELNTVCGTLANLAGWSAVTTLSDTVYARFDGQSVASALASVAESKGLHYRQRAVGERVIEIGELGDDTGLICLPAVGGEIEENPFALLIQDISLTRSSKDLVNVIVPVGAGEGDALLTLRDSTRTQPYGIGSLVGPDGRNVYYLMDSNSVGLYGRVERYTSFRKVTALSNTAADLENASNALYDIAAAHLARYSKVLEEVNVNVRASSAVNTSLIRAGNKVRLMYRGIVAAEDGQYRYFNVNDDFWIMEAYRRFGLEGENISLKLANVDRVEQDAAQLIVGALETIELRNVQVQPTLSHYQFNTQEEFDSTKRARMWLKVTNATRRLNRVLLRLRTRPLRATAKTIANSSSVVNTSGGGGNHRHLVAEWASISGFPSTTERPFITNNSSGGGAYHYLKIQSSGTGFWGIYTFDESGNHTHSVTLPAHNHAITYGIVDDTVHPVGVGIWINGTNRTVALGGTWGTGGAIDVTLDITEYLTPVQQDHLIEISCTSGQGYVEGGFDVQEVITSIELG